MSDLYHGLREGRRIGGPSARNRGFFVLKRPRAYPFWMLGAGPRSIVLALLVALLVAGVPSRGEAGAYGRVNAFVVRQKIHRDLPKITRCYESALRYAPELSGKVSVRFAVLRKGQVKGVHVVENTTGNDSVERCVTRVVSAIRFPSRRTGKSLRFTFPFVFAPQDGRWNP